MLTAGLLCPPLAGAQGVGRPAPELGLKTLDGGPVLELHQFRGQVVYLDFWATWCGPCQQSLPVLQGWHRELADRGFRVVGVNEDGDVKKAAAMAQRLQLTFPSISDSKGEVAGRYALPGMPASFLIDQQGRIRRVFKGFRPSEEKDIEREIAALLEGGGTQ